MGAFDIRRTPLFAESWNVAWRKGNPGKILSDTNTPFNIVNNSFRYWAADPFVYERNGETYIFAELYDYILCKGILGYCKIDGSKRTKWVPIIIDEHHLSYPCIIEHEDGIFLMPESSERKELLIYEAVDFPQKWEKRCVIRSEECFADTTPIKWNEHNLALTHKVDDPYNPRLLLIDLDNSYDDILIEQAIPFQSRPAGHVFKDGEKYIRPAQFSLDCDEGYGKGLLFYSFFINDNLSYSEKLIKKILPSELCYSRKVLADGMHTYNAVEQYEVIDIKTRRFNVINFVFRLLNKVVRRK